MSIGIIRRLLLIAVLDLICFQFTVAQHQDIREENKIGISFFTLGLFNGVSVDYFITPNVNVGVHSFPIIISPALFGDAEVGLSLNGGVGIKIYLSGRNADRKWYPFIGFEVTNPLSTSARLFYLPIGMHLIKKSGFQLSLEAAAIQLDEGPNSRDPWFPWAGIRIGKRF